MITNDRKKEYNCDDLFVNRWSPRAMSGEEISETELMTLFEAARWSPSSFNEQPWKFLYAKRDTKNWDVFFNLLTDGNKLWCKDAAVLIMVVGKKNFAYNNNPNKTFHFDSGAAWENLALQANIMHLVSHGMVGFDFEKAKKELDVSDDYQVLAMIAIGKPGKKENLPPQLQKVEFPNDRKKVSEFVTEGKFKR
ncbi:MAG: nitroreductase family protein [Candidatus Woesearchaeota archaeon]|jgi:nitroreductase